MTEYYLIINWPEWQRAEHLWDLHERGLPHTCSQGGQLPAQHCTFKVPRGGMDKMVRGCGWVISKGKGGQMLYSKNNPWLCAQLTFLRHWWWPHCLICWHLLSHKYSWEQGTGFFFCPHLQVFLAIWRQGPQSPTWQILTHWCSPQFKGCTAHTHHHTITWLL